jgi:VWFA-related protein
LSAQQSASPTSKTAPPTEPENPVLMDRPAVHPAVAAAGRNRIQLDVVVTDAKGNPVSGLTQQDFTLLDDKHPEPIASFHAYDAAAKKPDPSVQVILVLDMVNIGFNQVSYSRQQMMRFFQENGGHLTQPVSIYLLTEDGVSLQPASSTDGNVEAEELNQIETRLRTINRSSGVYGAIERFELSLRAIYSIVQTQTTKPGRKILIWVGPGWPMLSGLGFSDASAREQRQNFDMIVALSTELRENHTALYSISSGDFTPYSFLYQSFLKGVRSPQEEKNGDLDVKVLATQSGGLALGPDNNMTAQIEKCVRDASAFYTISFDPPRADRPDEYHDLKVQIDKPKLTARTNTGYYNQLPVQR